MGKDSKYLPILTRETYEDWFRRAKVKIKGKGAFFVIETSRVEYAWIYREGGAATSTLATAAATGTPATATTDTSSGAGQGDADINNITSQSDRIRGVWNIDKAKEWDLADAKALETILEGLDSDDAVLIDEYETAPAVWTQLKIKYEKTSISTTNKYMTLLQTFPYDKNIGIDGSWTKLKEYRRKLIAANGAMRLAYPDHALLLILTMALQKQGKYTAVIDGFLTQQSLSTEEKIKILGEKEAQLKDTAVNERAHAAQRQHKTVYRHPNHSSRRNSDSSDVSMANAILECFCCGSPDHFVADCKYQAASREYARKLRQKEERRDTQPSKHRSSSKRIQDSKQEGRRSTPKGRKGTQNKKRHGHAAAHESESESDITSTSATSTTDESESEPEPKAEKVMLSKEMIRKSTPTTWALDTGASSPMTDQLHLFREESLRSTSKVPIQVGGGMLYSHQRGTALVNAVDGTSGYLENVLFVPKLGVNLISAKKLCKGGLRGAFDDENIWITEGNKTVLQASQSQGLYIVKHISKTFKDKTIGARTKEAKATAMPAATVASDKEATDIDPDDSEPEAATTKEQRRWYRLMHRRFGHCGPDMLRKLHKVTSLQEAIKIPPLRRRVCALCKLAKMRNLTSRKLAKHKLEKLELVYLDIAGPFLTSIRGNRVFLQIVNSATRRT